ncbi:MAG TPA: hypothetical protein VK660_05255 [Xanthomonadaceae bacterium]|jgi:hypothetical protein|nr:hypothetical protein [Xanthomonadaceae bacterium]
MSDPKLRYLFPRVSAALLVLAFGGCASIGDAAKPTEARAWDLVSYDFSSDMHWGDWDGAYDFVDPKTKLEHPLTALDSARFKQVEVSGYTVVASLPGPGTYDQQIQLQIINRNTQQPRTVVYHEHWRWDAVAKRWWLTTGLPDITPQE